MSKDIWHKPSETTDVDNNLIIDDWLNRTYELGYFDDKDMIFRNLRNDDTYFEESMMRWCDVNELIDDYDRTRKVLDVVLKGLDDIIDSGGDVYWTAIKTKEQITALEQKESAFVHNKIEFPEFNDNLLEEFDKQFFENGQDDDLTETALEQKEIK